MRQVSFVFRWVSNTSSTLDGLWKIAVAAGLHAPGDCTSFMLILESFGSWQCVRVFGVFLSLDWTSQHFWSTTLFKHLQLRRSHENDEVWRSQARHCYMQQYPQESSLLQKKATCMMSLRLFFFPSIKFTDLTIFTQDFSRNDEHRWTAKTVGPVGSGPRVHHESVYGHYAGQNVGFDLQGERCA